MRDMEAGLALGNERYGSCRNEKDEYTYLAPCDRCGAVTSHNRRTGLCLACGVEKDKSHKSEGKS